MRILRLVARRTQRDLDDYDAVGERGNTRPAGRRRDLVRVARLTRARLADAQVRRR